MAKKTIRRAAREHKFSIVDNAPYENPKLSWKAKGILAYLLTKPDDWEVVVKQLIKVSKDGRDSTSGGVVELVKNGYLQRTQKYNKNNRFDGYDYVVHENPIPVNGFSVNGFSVNGKPVPTNNYTKPITNNTKDAKVLKTPSASSKVKINISKDTAILFDKFHKKQFGKTHGYAGIEWTVIELRQLKNLREKIKRRHAKKQGLQTKDVTNKKLLEIFEQFLSSFVKYADKWIKDRYFTPTMMNSKYNEVRNSIFTGYKNGKFKKGSAATTDKAASKYDAEGKLITTP